MNSLGISNKFVLIIIFVVCIIINPALSNNSVPPPLTGRISGTVIENETGDPLIGATVMIDHTSIGAKTNQNGEFVINNAPVGSQTVVASMMGYQIEKMIVNINEDATSSQSFKLKPAAFETGAITVTGTSTPHVFEDTPVKTELISKKMIEQKQAVNLAEALAFQTGVMVENGCGNCNFTQVRINGLDGKYSAVLIDGLPMMSVLAGVYGLEQMPEEMIQQIEIVKGGGSALYGGNAVAGIVNLITKKPMQNRTSLKYLGSFMGDIPDNHFAGVSEIISKDGHSGAYIFGSMRNRNMYDHNGDGFSELGYIKNESIGLNLFFVPFEKSELQLKIHHIHEDRRGGSITKELVHNSAVAEWTEHWRTGGAISWIHKVNSDIDYRADYSFALVHRDSYYGGLSGDTEEERLEALQFYGNSLNPLHLIKSQANLNTGKHLFTLGLEYLNEQLTDKTAANQLYHIDETYENTGFFVQDDIHLLNKKLQFVGGVRMDKHSEVKDIIISPRFNAKYEFAEGFNLRASFSTGFKAPQIFDEDLHVGALSGDQRIVMNSEDLKNESSVSFSGGIDYLGELGDLPFLFALNGFSTSIDDAFKEKFISKQNNVELWKRVNGSGAMVNGIEFSLGIKPVSSLELRGGILYKKSEFDERHEDFNTKKFFRTPDISANFRINYNPSHDLNIFALFKYLGKADIPHEVPDPEGGEGLVMLLVTSDSYLVLDMGFSYDIHIMEDVCWKLSFGVKNALNSYQNDLDVGVDRDPGYVYGPSQPRTLYIGFKTEL